jgi:hypothetical protein
LNGKANDHPDAQQKAIDFTDQLKKLKEFAEDCDKSILRFLN